MSAEALRFAVRDRLREFLELRDGECDVQESQKPPQSVTGILFISVHQGRTGQGIGNANGRGYYLDEFIGVGVTVSLKKGHIPRDRWGEKVANAIGPSHRSSNRQSIDWLSRQVIGIVHQRYPLVDSANANIHDDVSQFVEPLRVGQSQQVSIERTSEWWGVTRKRENTNGSGNVVGMSQTTQFVGARRIQLIEELEI